ncbi:hypothetical protein LRP88_14914 [Fusarium phalaenopsidis]
MRSPHAAYALFCAVYLGRVSLVNSPLAWGVPVDSKDQNGQTALFYAASKGHEGLVKILIDRGDYFEYCDTHKRTPLSHAAFEGYDRVAEILLAHGAGIDAVDVDGWIPLLHAVYHGHEDVVKSLLAKRSDRRAGTDFQQRSNSLSNLSLELVSRIASCLQAPIDKRLMYLTRLMKNISILRGQRENEFPSSAVETCKIETLGKVDAVRFPPAKRWYHGRRPKLCGQLRPHLRQWHRRRAVRQVALA